MMRSHRYFSFATWHTSMLSSSSPVTATTRSARWMPARSSTHSSVASPYCTACSNSSSSARYAGREDSISVTSWSLEISSRARLRPTFPPPTMITYMRSRKLGFERALEHLNRVLCGRNRVQTLFAVPAGTCGIHHAHDHPFDTEPLLRYLRDDQVRVVAVGRGDEHVRALDPRRDQRVQLESRADGELAPRVLPALRLSGVEALVRERVLVEDGHFVTGCERQLRH